MPVSESISILRNYQPSPSKELPSWNLMDDKRSPYRPMAVVDPFLLPPSHPQSRQHSKEKLQLKENVRPSPVKPVEIYEDITKNPGLHKRTKSAVSLKSLISNEKGLTPKPKSPKKKDDTKPKKSKSSTSLTSLLSKSKSSKNPKGENVSQIKGKENQTPPGTAEAIQLPIWAQFSGQYSQEIKSSKQIPLNDVHDLDSEMALYTPRDYSPTKQRNFCDYRQPSLPQKGDPKARPRSAVLASTSSLKTTLGEALPAFRKPTNDRRSSELSRQDQRSQASTEGSCKSSLETKLFSRLDSEDSQEVSNHSSKPAVTTGKRGSRVMAVVAALNSKMKEPTCEPLKDGAKESKRSSMDAKVIENAFERLLESRNISQETRDKMRLLDTKIKADLVKQDKSGSGSASSTEGAMTRQTDSDSKSLFRSRRNKTEDYTSLGSEDIEKCANAESLKKPRPRSRTFTLSKGDASPSKKQKSERPKSSDLTPQVTSNSLTSSGAAQALSVLTKASRPAIPEEFISYLRKTQAPNSVEVGKLQKLRQLLRNETVSWVDDFITRSGMKEVVGLLYRIIQVEWREEHEDALLHETLLCLKALCTTSLALQQLSSIQPELFPVLLHMLFDEEKKGPSEFATRNIIITLLFTHLSAAPVLERADRARCLLSYLRDPSPPESAQLPGFIASMHQPRPYRVWCKEIVNVTKEVFWIFLHHLNIVPFSATRDSAEPYATTYFPRNRPPVPAAPHVGSVEWDATNYLASHLDLLNGIIAYLPSAMERNMLRQELKDSGFEKCMGRSLRTCKEKYYGAVHTGLRTWVDAAKEDGWDVEFVRQGPGKDFVQPSPKKAKVERPPQLEMPKLDFASGNDAGCREEIGNIGWL